MNRHSRYVGPQARRVQFSATDDDAPSRRLMSRAARIGTSNLRQVLAFKGLDADLKLIIGYVVLSRAFLGDESTLGVKIGPMPLYVTDITLLFLIAFNINKRGGRSLNWVFNGGGAGAIGRAVWLLFLISIVYFALAFPHYRILAMRDLAIFGYSIFFPLTCFGLTQRVQAAKLVRYFIYATCVGALLFNFQTISHIKIFQLYDTSKGLPGHEGVEHMGGGNLGAALGPCLGGLFAYLAIEREHRALHAGALLLCLVTLARIMDRSALGGFILAGGLIFILGVGRSRVYLTAFAAGLFVLVLASVQAGVSIPGGARLQNFYRIVSSGADFQNDPDGQFRLQRWRNTTAVWMTSPVFGVGFGAPIMADTGDLTSETRYALQRGGLGAFNIGMPHNSFLTAGARTGFIGLGLILFAWFGGILRIVKMAIRGVAGANEVASAALLTAMITTASLNLFFERPMLCAPFWIMLAASYKLSETAPQPAARTLARSAQPQAANLLTHPFRYRRLSAPQYHVPGGWQTRWK
jgi:O-antigen ligase